MTHFIKKHAELILAALVAFFTPIFGLLVATGVMVLADLITGVSASIKLGEAFTSKKLSKSITKCTWYYLAIILGHVMETVFVEGIPIAKITAGIVATVEFKSNLENLKIITGIDFTKVLQNIINKERGV